MKDKFVAGRDVYDEDVMKKRPIYNFYATKKQRPSRKFLSCRS